MTKEQNPDPPHQQLFHNILAFTETQITASRQMPSGALYLSSLKSMNPSKPATYVAALIQDEEVVMKEE